MAKTCYTEIFSLILISMVFGSASRNQLRPDIDIGVAADRPLSAEQNLEITLELSSKLNRQIEKKPFFLKNHLVSPG